MTGNPTAALGCRWCGVEERGHVQLWHPEFGWHGWIEPTREQITERMRDRLGVTQPTDGATA
jgi:hypothetical protein